MKFIYLVFVGLVFGLRGMDVRNDYNDLRDGVLSGQIGKIEEVFKNNPLLNPNVLYFNGTLSPLMIASLRTKNKIIVTLLLEKGARALFKNAYKEDVMIMLTRIIGSELVAEEHLEVMGVILPYYVREAKLKLQEKIKEKLPHPEEEEKPHECHFQ